jgi:hypothetical protein
VKEYLSLASFLQTRTKERQQGAKFKAEVGAEAVLTTPRS